MIYVSSRRPLVALCGACAAAGVVLAGLAVAGFLSPFGWAAGAPFALGSLAALWAGGWAVLRLRAWPASKLALFRDRILVLQGRHEIRALWDRMESVTLADADSWPAIHLTDRLTIGFRDEPPIRLKPAEFGLDASACRDMILRLRDEPQLRGRLPEFDSARDLAVIPVVAGELSEPRF